MAVLPPSSPSPDPAKPALRAQLRAARDAFVLALSADARARLEADAARHLASLIDGAGCVAFYHALGSELGCAAAVDIAIRQGARIALPHVTDRRSGMRFLAWRPGDPLEEGWRGLVQPRADAPELVPDRVVTPLLGFDSALARLGQGAGFYDAAFAALPDARRIGFAWSVQQLPAIACDPWDVPLDAVVTEAGVIEGATA